MDKQAGSQAKRKVSPALIAEALLNAQPLDQFGTPRVRTHRECCAYVADAIGDVIPGFDRDAFLVACGAK